MNNDCIISIKGLNKNFNEKIVLKNINLNIKRNTITGIVGKNGSGKTVLLKIIAELYYPDNGNIVFADDLKIKEDFGFLIDTGFLDNETGFNNLKILALLKNIISDKDIIDTMKLARLNYKDKTKYRNYSAGMKQKLKISQAIMEKPKVLILDEPFNGLDIESVEYFRRLLLDYKKSGITIILTSHYQEDIDMLCDDVYRIVNGEII